MACWCVAGLVACAQAAAQDAGSASALLALYHRKADQLATSPLHRPVLIESTETADGLRGNVYAVVDHPLAEVSAALGDASQWCEMLVLHINNRRCRMSRQAGEQTLTLSVVRKYDMSIDKAFELPFVHRTVDAATDHLAVELRSEMGPFGTSRYRAWLEAVPVDARRSFLHFAYSYDHNAMARLATMAYLAIFGRNKVGFTVVGATPDGQPEYIRGLRGLVERNSMRYFLALDAQLSGHGAPPPERSARRHRRWFESIEAYPRQLHEVDLATYLALKHDDRERDASNPR